MFLKFQAAHRVFHLVHVVEKADIPVGRHVQLVGQAQKGRQVGQVDHPPGPHLQLSRIALPVHQIGFPVAPADLDDRLEVPGIGDVQQVLIPLDVEGGELLVEVPDELGALQIRGWAGEVGQAQPGPKALEIPPGDAHAHVVEQGSHEQHVEIVRRQRRKLLPNEPVAQVDDLQGVEGAVVGVGGKRALVPGEHILRDHHAVPVPAVEPAVQLHEPLFDLVVRVQSVHLL